MEILMLKDTPVYDITDEKILHPGLCPFRPAPAAAKAYATGTRTPSHMYDFNWANLHSRSEVMFDTVITYVKSAGAEAESCDILKPLFDACKHLNLTLWRNNAQDLMKNLKNFT